MGCAMASPSEHGLLRELLKALFARGTIVLIAALATPLSPTELTRRRLDSILYSQQVLQSYLSTVTALLPGTISQFLIRFWKNFGPLFGHVGLLLYRLLYYTVCASAKVPWKNVGHSCSISFEEVIKTTYHSLELNLEKGE